MTTSTTADATTTMATAYHWAQRRKQDDDSTLLGSRIASERSLDYSSSIDDGGASSITSTSSTFHADRYFQQEPAPPYVPPDWSHFQEERGRQFAKMLKNRNSKRNKTGFFQRALRGVFHRRGRHNNHKTSASSSTVQHEAEEHSITFADHSEGQDDDSLPMFSSEHCWEVGHDDEEESHPEPPHMVGHSLDEISDCTSNTSIHGVEVFQNSSPSSSEDEDELSMSGVSVQQQQSSYRRRLSDLYYPEGLFVRTSADELIDKLHLGDQGRSAMTALDQATEAAAAKSLDPTKCSSEEIVPTLVTIGGYDVPDYATYVRQAVTNFRIHVLKMSDELYELLEKRSKTSLAVVSKLTLLPFAVEFYCLERLAMHQSNSIGEEASI